MSSKVEKPGDSSVTGLVLEIGTRLKTEPSRRLVAGAFQAELDAQLSLFDALSRVDLAHTLMMSENGVVPADAAQDLIAALYSLRQQAADFHPDAANGDLYTNREAWLAGRTSAVAWLGAGRARREAITTAYHIKLREGLIALTDALIELAQTMVERSEGFADALMPDYTYLQQAQPTSFGHYLLGFAFSVLRDLQRIQAIYSRINQSPAGCGSSNGSRLPQSRERLAELLGFDGLVMHARDAMWQADLQIELAGMLTAVSVNLDRLAEDLQIFSSDEFCLVELDDSHARASKIMPQKKNPFALTHIRGQANTMIGLLAASAAMGRTPSGQPDNRLTLYGAMPKAMDDACNSVSLMGEVITLLRFNDFKARSKLDHGFLSATDLAEALVLECGIAFREAHRVVGQLVHRHLADGDFRGLTVKELAECAEDLLGYQIISSEQALNDALRPEKALACRKQTGGAAPVAMDNMLSHCRRTLQEVMVWRRQRVNELNAAEAVMEQGLNLYLKTTKARI